MYDRDKIENLQRKTEYKINKTKKTGFIGKIKEKGDFYTLQNNEFQINEIFKYLKNFKLKGINISTLKEKNFLFLKDVIDLFDTEEEHKLVEQREEQAGRGKQRERGR